MTDSILSRITDVLEEQSVLYDDLLSLARKKQEILVAGGGSEFETVLRGEQTLMVRAGRLEEQRLALQSDLAAVLGLSPEKLTVSGLIELSEAPAARRLKELGGRIRLAVDELRQVNDLNLKLLQRSLAYIQSMFQAFGRLKKSAVYCGDGRYSPPEKRTRLDQQI